MDQPIQINVFVIAPVKGGDFAATTRDDGKRIDLPGGKVDKGETLVEAVIRESAEEGWDLVDLNTIPFFRTRVDGNPTIWFMASEAVKRSEWKEKGRIVPVVRSEKTIAQAGFKNDQAFSAYNRVIENASLLNYIIEEL